jgi:hypothetical protein
MCAKPELARISSHHPLEILEAAGKYFRSITPDVLEYPQRDENSKSIGPY